MAATRRGRPVGAGRVDRAKVAATTDDDIRRHMAEDGFDPDNPLEGFRPIVPVATLRRRLDLSQESFAEALRIPVKTLRNWEQGRTQPDPVVLSFFALVADDPARAFRVLQPGIPTSNDAAAVRRADDDAALDRIVEKLR